MEVNWVRRILTPVTLLKLGAIPEWVETILLYGYGP